MFIHGHLLEYSTYEKAKLYISWQTLMIKSNEMQQFSIEIEG